MKSFSDDINEQTSLPEIPEGSFVKPFSDDITYGVPDEFGLLEDILKLVTLQPKERKEPIYRNSPVQPGGGIRQEIWDERAEKVAAVLNKENPKLKLDSKILNRYVAQLGAALAIGTGGDFTFHDKILRDMGYSRNNILKVQSIKGGEEHRGIPPWGVTRWEVSNLVEKSGWSVNQALKYLKEHKGIWKRKVDVIIKGRKAYTPKGVEIKGEANLGSFGEYYHRDVGWY